MKTFQVTDEDIKKMKQELSKSQHSWNKEDLESLSKVWIQAVMSQPSKENKNERRSFEYSKKKIQDYLDWRKKTLISSKISRHLSTERGEELMKLTKSSGALYWYNADKDGSPILWYHSNLTSFDNINVKDEMEYSAIVMQAAIDAMPDKTYNFNFVICFDIFNPLKALKHPTLAPAFINTFMKVCPDRLKRGLFLTGSLGHIFYNVAKRVASANIMDKVIEVRTRKEAAEFLVREELIKEHQVPTFFGGAYEHEHEVTTCFPIMVKKIKESMKVAEESPAAFASQ